MRDRPLSGELLGHSGPCAVGLNRWNLTQFGASETRFICKGTDGLPAERIMVGG